MNFLKLPVFDELENQDNILINDPLLVFPVRSCSKPNALS